MNKSEPLKKENDTKNEFSYKSVFENTKERKISLDHEFFENKDCLPCGKTCAKCCKSWLKNFGSLVKHMLDSKGECKHLDPHTNKCKIYEKRPLICQFGFFYEVLSKKKAFILSHENPEKKGNEDSLEAKESSMKLMKHRGTDGVLMTRERYNSVIREMCIVEKIGFESKNKKS
ncbi:hypothetical protein HMPREF1430_00235 [Helicobacter pylori GAM96Ai]|uniref:YkgJ family cysteine cluster protein n=1 Tax=Helicobacter pylori TaxID=210 RepID=UPI0002BC4A9D|nr:YkgJ family cysteine cluster protein [Helicobacter pylori]EMH44820.1 hypothetical protein HMPREF1430_00235 [Helicobacter pylori GAM96Ai]